MRRRGRDRWRTWGALIPALGAAVVLALAAPAWATTIHVHNQHDAGSGSLRHAIAHADPGDTIVVPAGTYKLKTGELSIDDPLTIKGAGASKTIIDARGDSRVLELTASADPVTISGVAITGGRDQYGGGILNAGRLTLRRDVIRGNRAAGGSFNGGGGVENSGTLKLIRSTMRNNKTSATQEGFGGAIDAGHVSPNTTGPITIVRSSFTGNATQRDGFGGAIAVQPTSNPEDADLTIKRSTFARNSAITGPNFASQGGAIFYQAINGQGVSEGLELRANTFAHNRAVGLNSATSFGGAITFFPIETSGNSNSPLTLVNNTITANTAGGAGENGSGGGLVIEPITSSGATAVLTLINNTIAGNTATGAGQGGGIYFYDFGAGPPALKNTIVANNHSSTGRDCSAHVVSAGHNLERHESCGLTGTGDQQNTDPLLGRLRDNGGPTQTKSLRRGSPAINRGTNDGCPATDQRGVHRPQGPRCDIGAFERQPRHHH